MRTGTPAAAALLSTAEAARICGISPQTLLRAVRRGELEATQRRPGGAFRFAPDDLAAFAARGSHGRAPARARPSRASGARTSAETHLERLLDAAAAPYHGVDALIGRILATLAESLDVPVTYLTRVDGDALHVERVYERGAMTVSAGQAIALCDTFCHITLARARALAVPDARAEPPFASLPTTTKLGIGSYSGTPLSRADGRLYGTLCTLHSEARPIARSELTLLGLAGQLVMQAIEHTESEARATAELRDSEERLRAVLDTAPISLATFGTDGVITLSLGSALRAMNRAAGASVGHSLFTLYANYPELCASARQAIAGKPSACVVELSGVVFDLRFTPRFDFEGRVAEVITVGTDVTARARAQESLRRQATHDVLTGLPNRRLLYERLERAFMVSRRTELAPAVLFLDLDGFKQVNDSFGHDGGDLLLQEVARRLTTVTRNSDTVARLGGDEFVILLPALLDAKQATVVADKVLAVLSEPYALGPRLAHVSASIGIALAGPELQVPETLVILADRALYTAKQEGKNRFVVSDEYILDATPAFSRRAT